MLDLQAYHAILDLAIQSPSKNRLTRARGTNSSVLPYPKLLILCRSVLPKKTILKFLF